MALIGLISDVHAAPEPVAEALSIFKKAGVQKILCAGDIAGYNQQLEATIKLLVESHCQTIKGNHDLQYLDHHEDELNNFSSEFLKQLPDSYATTIEGKSVYMVHAQPPDACQGGIKLLDKHGLIMPEKIAQWTQTLQTFAYDVLIVGHTHQVYAQWIGDTLVVNPGSSTFNHCCMILRLPQMTVQMFALQGQAIATTWNWGEHVIYRK